MKIIPLTQGKFALVDDADYEWLNQFKWYAIKGYKTMYALRNSQMVNGYRTTLPMHRVILNLTDPKIYGDHKDGNGLNNQRYNLRSCTHQENLMNSNQDGRSSKYKGVSWIPANEKWRAFAYRDGKRYWIGYFDNEIAAAMAYNEVAKKVFGEFAFLNKF